MASGNKEQGMKFFNFEDEEELKSKKAVVKKRIKKENNKKIEEEEEKKKENGKFSFDNEIIIGVTKKEVINNSKKQNDTKKNNRKNNKKDKVKNNSQKAKKNKQLQNRKIKQKEEIYIESDKIISQNEKEDKKRKKSKIGPVIKCVALIIIIIGVIILALFSPLFNIKEIKVEGNEKVSQNEIISLSKIELQENMFKINKQKVKEQVKENAYINTIKVIRNIPSTIILQVEERKEAYLIEYAESYIYIDKQGYILEVGAEKKELPILQGLSTDSNNYIEGKRLEKEDLEKLEIAYKITEIAQNNGIDDLVTRIDLENIKNVKIIFETKGKTAYIGDSSNLLDKIRIIKKIIEEEEGNNGEIFVNMDLNTENPIFRQNV